VNGFDGDLMRRSLAAAGEEADERGTSRRKARPGAFIARLKGGPIERARIDSIEAAGIEGQAGNSEPTIPYDIRVSGIAGILKRTLSRLRPNPRRRKYASHAGIFLVWLGGGDTDLLANMPEDRARFIQMALVLLTTAGIAAMSMMFALYNAVNASLLAAVILGLLWGGVIFNLDRFLVLSMRRTNSRWRLVGMALPRVALATVLALVISTPLVLRIFASDINAELVTLHQEKARQLAAQVQKDAQGQRAAQVQDQINADQAVLAGHLAGPASSPQLQDAQAQVNQLQPKVASAQRALDIAAAAWQCELYGSGPGCEGASNLAGNGPIAQAKKAIYQQDLATYSSLNQQLRTAQAALSKAQNEVTKEAGIVLAQSQAEARSSLPRLQAQLQALQSQIQKEIAAVSAVSNADTGILAQLQALSAISATSPSLAAARLTVLALFLLIEILPVTVRFLLNLGPETAYDSAVQLKEKQLIHIRQLRYDEERSVEKIRSQTRISLEKDIRESGESIDAGEMVKILDKALQEWKQRNDSTVDR
jgi:Domain of unknown function (DUF4407)